MPAKKPITQPVTPATELGFQAQVYNLIEDLPNKITWPDNTNTGKLYAMLMLWKKVKDMAEKKYDSLMKQLTADELVKDPKTLKTPGTFVLGETKKLTVEVNVSQPRKEFNFEWFAQKLQTDYKVPIAVTRALMEQAKQPGDTQNRTVSVKEKGIAI